MKYFSKFSEKILDIIHLTQVMSGHGAFNAYLFRKKLVENPKCDRRGRDDDAWHALFECPAFQLYWEDVMITRQKKVEQHLTPDSLVPIMLKSADGWGQVAVFGALTMRRKMKKVQERPRRPIAATTQHPMPDLAIPPPICHYQTNNRRR